MVAARKIGRSLISIKLSRNLGRRPNVGSLVEHNILPEECVVLVAGKGRDGRGGGYVSPRLVGVKRRLERESVKDGLRGWLSGKRRQELERREMEEVERSVTTLVRRFAGKAKERERERERARDKKERERWGRAAIAEEKRRTGAPTRAHVLGLRRFWESIGKASAT
ncbi:MAG: hypothetical protein MMC33_004168 [Icmadophila ericetorum]|nr:hypothetical protein [Icmadophila ericetorum]